MKTNINLVGPIVTLRNLKYCCYLNNNSIPPRIAAEISYTARFPQNEKKEFQEILKKFGEYKINKKLNEIIELGLEQYFLYYNDSYKNTVYLALSAIRESLHPLLIGKKGCGLTNLAKLIHLYIKKIMNFYFVALNLIGCYQPKIKNKDKIQDLSSYIKWNDGLF